MYNYYGYAMPFAWSILKDMSIEFIEDRINWYKKLNEEKKRLAEEKEKQEKLNKQLWNVVLQKNLKEIEFYFLEGADINAENWKNEFPLDFAAENKDKCLIKFLLALGGELNYRILLDSEMNDYIDTQSRNFYPYIIERGITRPDYVRKQIREGKISYKNFELEQCCRQNCTVSFGGRRRKVYVGSRGGSYYKRKGRKVYLKN